MNPFQVYKHYLALRLHFTTNKYDIVAARGRIRASEKSFRERSDVFDIHRLAKKYEGKEVIDYLVANFVSGNRCGGIHIADGEKRYLEWKAKIESLSYRYRQELVSLCESAGDRFGNVFKCDRGSHPLILRSYLNGKTCLETLVILNKVRPFVDTLDNALANDIVWPDVSRLIRKYSPFVRIDKDKYIADTLNILTDQFPEEQK
jgi:hypothetical protein